VFDHLADNVADEAILFVAACRSGPDGDPPAALPRVADRRAVDGPRVRFPRFSGVFEDWFDLVNQGGRLCCQHHGSTAMSCGNERFGCIGSPSRDQRSASWASC
jgi:hypothetical protein